MRIPSRDEIERMDAEAAKFTAAQLASVTSSLVAQNDRQARVISELFKKIAESEQPSMYNKDALAKLQRMLFGDRTEKLPPLSHDGVKDAEGGQRETKAKKPRTKFGRSDQGGSPRAASR